VSHVRSECQPSVGQPLVTPARRVFDGRAVTVRAVQPCDIDCLFARPAVGVGSHVVAFAEFGFAVRTDGSVTDAVSSNGLCGGILIGCLQFSKGPQHRSAGSVTGRTRTIRAHTRYTSPHPVLRRCIPTYLCRPQHRTHSSPLTIRLEPPSSQVRFFSRCDTVLSASGSSIHRFWCSQKHEVGGCNHRPREFLQASRASYSISWTAGT
jgi:hypothetical protein